MIPRTVSQRLFKGIGANLYGQAMVALVQLAGVPILISAWGIHTYGEWLIISAIPGYLSMTNLGFSMSAANDMTKLEARGARSESLAVFQSLFVFILVMSMLIFVIATTLIWVLPIGHWTDHGGMSQSATRVTLWCLCVDILVKLFDGLNHAGFRCTGEYALHQFIFFTILFMQQSIIWVVALTGHSPEAAAFFYMCFSMSAIPSTAILMRFRHGWLKLGTRQAQFSELRRLSGPALGNLSGTLSGSLSIQGMTLVVAALLGPIQVVTLSTLRIMTRLAVVLVSVVSMASEPEFATLGELPDRKPLLLLFGQMLSVSFWIAAGTALTLFAIGPWLLHVWTHGRVVMDYPLFCWLLGTVLSQTMWNGSLALLRGRNEHMSATIFQVLTTLTSIGLAALSLAIFHEISAVGLVLFIMDIVFLVFVLRQINLRYGLRIRELARFAIDPTPVFKLLMQRRFV